MSTLLEKPVSILSATGYNKGIGGDTMPTYTVTIHPNEEGDGYWAKCAIDERGCAFTSGDTIQETQINMYESFSLLIEDDYPDVTDYLFEFVLAEPVFYE